MPQQPLYKIRARETFTCPICNWRVTHKEKETSARTEMRWHMKHEHRVDGKQIKLLSA